MKQCHPIPPCPVGPVVPPMYPYMGQNYYACDCCNHMHQPTPNSKYPANGPMQGSAFMVVNTVPYILDNTQIDYGTKISVADSIYTRITSRKDVSCVNLAGTFDMTGDLITNTAMTSFFLQTVENEYQELEKYLDIQKSTIEFKLNFHVEDVSGGVVYESSVKTYAQNARFHYTDVQDYFVTSFKQIFQCDIPSLDFQGVYNLILDSIEASANVIKTKDHITDDMNPYYQFTNNNSSIVVQHDTIQQTVADGSVVIAHLDLNHGLPFQANLTTRLRLSFTAFMSNTIAMGNTFELYNALYQPTTKIVDRLAHDVAILTGLVMQLQQSVNKLYFTSQEYEKGIALHKGVIVWITPGELYQTTDEIVTNNDEEKTVEEALQADIDEGKIVKVTGGE